MFLDVIDAVLQITKPLAQVGLQQASDDVFEVGTEMRRKSNLHKQTRITQHARRHCVPVENGRNGGSGIPSRLGSGHAHLQKSFAFS